MLSLRFYDVTQFTCITSPTEEGGVEHEKRTIETKPHTFGIRIFFMFSLRKCIPTFDIVFRNKKIIDVRSSEMKCSK